MSFTMKARIVVILMAASFLFARPSTAEKEEMHHGSHTRTETSQPLMHMHDESHEKDHQHMDTGAAPATGHDGHDHEKMVMEAEQAVPDLEQQVKVEERLGKFAALDTRFKDENGNDVFLASLFDKPVVILPIFFSCTDVCNFLQADLANALNQVNQLPGKDFNVITLSFSDDEDFSIARTSKQNYTNLINREFPLENWFYLTGDKENIRKLTDSLGYYFIKREKNVYIHPSTLVVLAEDGMIARYLYGPGFLPFDLGMALMEAQKGETGISIKRGVLSFCFDYDPENKTYVFKVFRITGSAVLVMLLGFIIFLLYPSKKNRRKPTE